MGRVLRTVFQLIIYFAILHEHVEDCVLSVVYSAKSVLDDLLLTFIAKCDLVNFVIHLQFDFLIIRSLHIELSEFVICLRISTLPKVQLARDFGNIQRSTDLALLAGFEELDDHLRNIINIIQIEFFEWLSWFELFDHSLISINMCPC